MGNVADLVAALRRIEVATRHVVLAREQDSIELRGQFAGMLADEALIIRDKYDIGLLHYNMAKVVAAAESIRSSVTAARGRSEAIHPRLALKHVQAIREEIKVLVPILERIHLRLK